MQNNHQAPQDTALIAVLRQFDSDGYTGQFRAIEGPALLCLTCHQSSPISAIDANRIVRLEGASDPADMLTVMPVRCPKCGRTGTLVSNYGPETTVEEAELLVALDRSPGPVGTDRTHPAA